MIKIERNRFTRFACVVSLVMVLGVFQGGNAWGDEKLDQANKTADDNGAGIESNDPVIDPVLVVDSVESRQLNLYNSVRPADKQPVTSLKQETDQQLVDAIYEVWYKDATKMGFSPTEAAIKNAILLSSVLRDRYPTIPENAVVTSISGEYAYYYLNGQGYSTENKKVREKEFSPNGVFVGYKSLGALSAPAALTGVPTGEPAGVPTDAPAGKLNSGKVFVEDEKKFDAMSYNSIFRLENNEFKPVDRGLIESSLYKNIGQSIKDGKVYYVFDRVGNVEAYSDNKEYRSENPKRIYALVSVENAVAIIPGKRDVNHKIAPTSNSTKPVNSYRPHQNTIFSTKSRMRTMDIDASNTALGE